MKMAPWRFVTVLVLGGLLCACASVPKTSAPQREPVDVRLHRAVIHALEKKQDLAHAEVDGVLEEAPLYQSAWIVRACLFLEQGKLDAAAMGALFINGPRQLLGRLRRTQEQLTPEERHRLGQAVWKLGVRNTEGGSSVERVMGHELMEQGALLTGDEAGRALAAAAVQRALMASVAATHFQLRPWPLPSFQREWLDALLDEEGRLLETFVAR
ncbi:hypothetical protein [Corallococcus caeni]|uniref:Lipoprotein n=1 Tax=Corallococcus caeni TaxID=3082388 RepID=A0ABQ6QU39_9BACT|nr:hypothetical protein ASNO1_37640 [Corallococcus sp. NO1]